MPAMLFGAGTESIAPVGRSYRSPPVVGAGHARDALLSRNDSPSRLTRSHGFISGPGRERLRYVAAGFRLRDARLARGGVSVAVISGAAACWNCSSDDSVSA
jgi:hypothetical protein